MRDVIFSKSNMKAIFDEGEHLLERHYREIARYQDIPKEMDEERYFALERENKLAVYVAREMGEMIGYAVFFVTSHIHYKSSLTAVQDIIFVHPEKRGFGMKFIKWCDSQLRELGAQVVCHHVKLAHNFGPALERIGYEHVENIYMKRLDAEA